MNHFAGYSGRLLEVDLSSANMAVTTLPEKATTEYIGGAGLNAWLAYRHIPPGIDPLSPDNVLIFGAGPLVGTLAPAAGKTNFTSKSPVSGFIGTSGSGHMGGIKFGGFDHILIKGRSNTPVYIEIGDEVRIRKAGHLWGKDTWDSTDAIWQELGRQYAVACIGPAGENMVRDASIVANKYSLFAKTGMGAVMGSKNLKGIAAFGCQGIAVAHPKQYMSLVNKLNCEISSLPYIADFRNHGTLLSLPDMINACSLSIPYKNAQAVADQESMRNFTIEDLERALEHHGNIACQACPVGCKHVFRLKDGPAIPVSCAGAPAVCFGGLCAVDDWTGALQCEELVNRLGMDNASAGLAAWIIELYQRGIIDHNDTDGMELDWHPATVQKLLRKIACREGLGNMLADGFLEAPQKLGRGSGYYAHDYKGVGSTTGDPRPQFNSWICSMITNSIGHASGVRELYGEPAPKIARVLEKMGIPAEDIDKVFAGPEGCDMGWLTRLTEDYTFALECLGVCTFPFNQRFDIGTWAQVYTSATGFKMEGKELLAAAARGLDLRKAFNLREGASRRNDTMPTRFLSEPVHLQDEVRPPFDRERLDRLVSDYYAARGWDPQTGEMSPERLEELTKEN